MEQSAMMIYGISQSSGVERQLHFELVREGIILLISDLKDEVKRSRILVNPESLLNAVMERTSGAITIEGKSPSLGSKRFIDMEIRRNEVLLKLHSDAEKDCDVAVGLDDFQDALEKAIG
jgi:hypothetical protein